MDPNEALRELRMLSKYVAMSAEQLARGVRTHMPYQETNELAEKFQELDEWMSRGGFLPDEWKRGHEPRRT